MKCDILDTKTISVRGEVLEMPVIRCPHCGNGAEFRMLANAESQAGENRIHGVRTLAIGFCVLCSGPVYFHLSPRDEVVMSYPQLKRTVPPGLPEKVEKAFNEALICLANGAPNGTLLMLRRAIQEALNDLKAPPGDLPKQLQALVDRDKITPDMKEWADHARIGGRIAAHGTGGEEWGDASQIWGELSDAEAVMEFCEAFCEYVYWLPKRNAERRAKTQIPPASPLRPDSNEP